jgi:spermidine synthase
MELFVIWAVVGFALWAFVRWGLPALLELRGVHMTRHTMFGAALVFDSEDEDGTAVRLLNVNGTFQSVSYVDDCLWAELVCMYHRHFAEALDVAGWPSRALVLGGGGYSFPKYLIEHNQSICVDAVEIDPKITELARTWFGLDRLERDGRGRLSLVNEDGWAYLRKSSEPYGLVVNDAFAGKRPLGPMGTAEGARIIHEHLTADGLYMANVIAPLEGRGARVLEEVLDAFTAELGHVYVFAERPETPTKRGNNALIASSRPLALAGADIERHRDGSEGA